MSLRPRDQVFGRTAPGDGFLHRVPAGVKVAGLAVFTLAVLLLRDPWVSTGAVGVVIILCLAAQVPLRMLLALLGRIWILLLAVLSAQLIFNYDEPAVIAEVMTRILACLLAAQLVILTTPPTALLGVFRMLMAPLRVVGLNPGRIALAGMVMLRAIPYLADLSQQAGRQARARGLERNVTARTVPLALGAVDYARDTGKALTARGIDELG